MTRIITLTPNPALDFSARADHVVANEKIRCAAPRTDPGGGGINVARAAHRLGADVLAIYTAGGIYGDALTAVVEAEHIPSIIISVEGETRLSFAARDEASGDEYRFSFPGAKLSDAEAAQFLASLKNQLREGDFVIGSGSLPPGADPCFYAQAAKITKAAGARFVLDSTSGVDEALAEGIFLIRANKHETRHLAGRDLLWPGEQAAFAQNLAKSSAAERVIVTQGGEGALMASKTGVARASSMGVKIVSAVGAGDSFMGALLVAMGRSMDDKAALTFAMAGAGATLMTPGTALFDPAEVERLFQAATPQ